LAIFRLHNDLNQIHIIRSRLSLDLKSQPINNGGEQHRNAAQKERIGAPSGDRSSQERRVNRHASPGHNEFEME
jgi:hypothetical protein